MKTPTARMLTTDQIIKLSDHGLKRYKNKILRVRDFVHTRASSCEINMDQLQLTGADVAYIRHLDKVAGDVYRETERRKLERRKQRFGY